MRLPESPGCKASEMPRNEACAETGLKHRIFVSDQGEAKHLPAGILAYVEDLMRGLNADMERKDMFQTGFRRSDST
jgi:hypothetical protein